MLEPLEAWKIENTRLSLGCVADGLVLQRHEALHLIGLVQTLDAENKAMNAELQRLRGVRSYEG